MPTHFTSAVYLAVQHPLAVFLGASLLSLLLLQWPPARRPLGRALRSVGPTLLLAASSLTLLLYFCILGWYLSLPNFAGEVEPTVTSISWMAAHGAPLYHGLEAAVRYSVLYGPAIFLVNGWLMQWLGPSAATAKLAGVLAGASSMVFLYLALCTVVNRRMSLWLSAAAVLLYFIHGPFSYLSRPDPLILSAASFALLSAVQRRRWLSTLGIAMAVAWAVDMKIHGLAYLLVPLALHHRRHGARHTAISLVVGLLLATTPFLLLDNVSLSNYLLWLEEATRHGLDPATFERTLRFALFMLLPVGVMGRNSWNRDGLLLGALGFSYVSVLVFASKPGAGLNHLLPLIPSTLFVLAGLLRHQGLSTLEDCLRLGRLRQAAVAGIFLAAVFVGGIAQSKCLLRLHGGAARGDRVLAELREVVHEHPELRVAMAYGGEGGEYELTFYRPHLLFAGQPLLLDVIACMETQRSRRELPQETYEAMRSGQVQLWLVPKGGEPFHKKNWYAPHQNVFPAAFTDILRDRYRLRESTEFFDLWYYEPGLEARPAAAAGTPANS